MKLTDETRRETVRKLFREPRDCIQREDARESIGRVMNGLLISG